MKISEAFPCGIPCPQKPQNPPEGSSKAPITLDQVNNTQTKKDLHSRQ